MIFCVFPFESIKGCFCLISHLHVHHYSPFMTPSSSLFLKKNLSNCHGFSQHTPSTSSPPETHCLGPIIFIMLVFNPACRITPSAKCDCHLNCLYSSLTCQTIFQITINPLIKICYFYLHDSSSVSGLNYIICR